MDPRSQDSSTDSTATRADLGATTLAACHAFAQLLDMVTTVLTARTRLELPVLDDALGERLRAASELTAGLATTLATVLAAEQPLSDDENASVRSYLYMVAAALGKPATHPAGWAAQRAIEVAAVVVGHIEDSLEDRIIPPRKRRGCRALLQDLKEAVAEIEPELLAHLRVRRVKGFRD